MRTTLATLLLLHSLALSQAKEVIVLQNDGRVEGDIVADENLPKTQQRIKTSAGGQIVIDKTAIKQVVIIGKDEAEYENLRRIARTPSKGNGNSPSGAAKRK